MTTDGGRLGIDFGTSSTVAVLSRPDGRSSTLLFDSSPLLPSAVCLDAAGALLVGRDAIHAGIGAPERFEPYPKRRIDDGEVLLGGSAVGVVSLISAVLSRVLTEARRVAPVQAAVLTHPASWGPRRRSILDEAAQHAGLPNVALVAEPVAAAAYFASVRGGAISDGVPLVVYDFGAGTFDATVVRRTGDDFTVLATRGLDDTGGLDVDAAVVAYLATSRNGRDPAWTRLVSPATPGDRRAARQLWEHARTAKEALSRHSSTMVFLPLLDAEIPLGREQLDLLAQPVIDRTVSATRGALLDAGIDAQTLAGVFLVGGASRMPLAATALHRVLRVASTVLEQPELVVAEGSLRAVAAARTPPQAAEPEPATWPQPAAEPVAWPGPQPAAEPVAWPQPAAPPPAPTPPMPLLRAVTAPAGKRSAPGGDSPWTTPRFRLAGVVLVIVVLIATVTIWSRVKTDPAASSGAPTGSCNGFHHTEGSPVPDTSVAVFDGESVAFSANGRILVAGAELLDTRSHRPVGCLRESAGYSVAFTGDGKILATSGQSSSSIPTSTSSSLVINWDGNAVQLWNAATLKPLGRPISDDPRYVIGRYAKVAFSKDGTKIAIAGGGKGLHEGRVQIWDVASREPIGAPLTGYDQNARSLAFSADGRFLATADQVGQAIVWEVATGRNLGAFKGYHVAFSENGKLLAIGDESSVNLYDATTRSLVDSIPVMQGKVGIGVGPSVAFSPDSGTLAIGGYEGTERPAIQLWDIAARKWTGAKFTGPTNVIDELTFSPDGTLLAAYSWDLSVRLWKVPR